MKLVQQRYHDQPVKPLELAKFWVEYVLRNNGAEHIKSPAQQLNFFQYHGLDLFGFLFAVIFGLLFSVCRLCGCGKQKPAKQKRN
jgi:UDP-glucoronosyl and UDP-glucosyl transferase